MVGASIAHDISQTLFELTFAVRLKCNGRVLKGLGQILDDYCGRPFPPTDVWIPIPFQPGFIDRMVKDKGGPLLKSEIFHFR